MVVGHGIDWTRMLPAPDVFFVAADRASLFHLDAAITAGLLTVRGSKHYRLSKLFEEATHARSNQMASRRAYASLLGSPVRRR